MALAATLFSIPPEAGRRGTGSRECAPRWVANDGDGAAPHNAVMPRACGASSTLRLLDSITDASGILDRPLSRTMTAESVAHSYSSNARSRREAPEALLLSPAQRARGERRMPTAPAASCALVVGEKLLSCPGRGAALLQRCSAEPGPRAERAARWTPDQQRITVARRRRA
jgi:hypothetical protein